MNSHRSDRRRVLQGLSAAVAAMALPSLARGQDLQGTVLRLGTWGGSWRDALDKMIGASLRTRGLTIEYVLGNASNNLAKLVAARGRALPLDSMELVPDVFPLLMQGKFVEKMNVERIPNAKAVPAFAKSEYAVGTTAHQGGVVYNTKRFEEAGVPPPQRLSDLANPKLAGRVAFPDVSHGAHYKAVAALAFEAGGDETTPEKAVPLIKKIKPALFYSSSPDLATRFGSGEIWAAPWYAGFAVRLKRTGLPVAFLHPMYGSKRGAMEITSYSLLQGSKNAEGAGAFLDAYLSPEVQFEFSKFAGTVPMNLAARTRLMEDPETKDTLLLSDAELRNAFSVDYSRVDMARWRDTWARQVLG
jgi:putative spermidine/putrescine transport system substrate-binding protein